MGIKLAELRDAATRFDTFVRAEQSAPPEAVAKARFELGVVNAERFTSKSDRLAVLAHAVRTAKAATGVIAPQPVDAPALLRLDEATQEVAFGTNDLRPIRYLEIGLLAAKAVGKITVRGVAGEDGDATGFLVAPGLLLTNHHVLPSFEVAQASYVSFNQEDGLDGKPKSPKLFDLNPSELYVADKDLDYCFVAIAAATADGESSAQFGFLRLFEQPGKVDPNRKQAANIIQHPLGQDKRVVLRDNYFMEPPKDRLDATGEQNSLFYGADTLKGSSGSPVCTDEWFAVALHRGGVPKIELRDGKPTIIRLDNTPAREGDSRASIAYVTNEGTRVSRIYASLRGKVAAAGEQARAADAALRRIKVVAQDPLKQGPVSQTTIRLGIPEDISPDAFGMEEKLIRRKPDFFEGMEGYLPDFLAGNGADESTKRKYRIELPKLTFEAAKDAARLRDSDDIVLNYVNYSLVMNGARRTAFFAAGNVDGAVLWKNVMNRGMPKRPSWTFDPRMDDEHQPDDEIFSTAMQRGHLFKREDAVQGSTDEELERADFSSFVITNATPMIANFNNVEWGDLEDIITRHLEEGNRVSYFAGPIFSVEDKFFNQLKAGAPAGKRKQGMRVPTEFWKIVAWVEDGKLKAAGFVLDQSDEIRAHGPITEEIDFGEYEQTPIRSIEERTGLAMPQLRRADTFR
ncbi:DNA/RNA non-specific endonuclease [Ramlibacter sp. XY19]|uniref:DNA/RNA non-specific endonuclease n=1 Tax=Ramlibacter paludis TaxID=2908000 RepID=UPI0023DB671D|nr:DNA/RNA non-specific endonuclease [Ramlibacter paludis]MCG2592987.1 DNA/RNA non-specific endonuclease [Ramlibacter paludis]